MDAIFVATPHFLPSASPPFLPARCCLTASHITEASHIPGCVQPLDDGPDGLPPNRLYILVQHTNSLLLLRSQVQTVTVRDQRHLLRRPHHPSAWREGSHPDSERHRDAVVHDTYGPAQRWSVRGHVPRRLQRVLQWWLLAQRLVLLPLLLRAAHWRRHQSTTITSLGTPKSSFKSSFVPLVCRAGRPCHRDLSLLYDELRAFLHLRQWKRHRCEYRPDPNHDLGADSMAVSYTGQLAQSVTDYDGAW